MPQGSPTHANTAMTEVEGERRGSSRWRGCSNHHDDGSPRDSTASSTTLYVVTSTNVTADRDTEPFGKVIQPARQDVHDCTPAMQLWEETDRRSVGHSYYGHEAHQMLTHLIRNAASPIIHTNYILQRRLHVHVGEAAELRDSCVVLVVEDTLLPGVWIMDGLELVEEEPSLHNSGAVTQGLRACWWCYHSRLSEGACKAQLSAPAAPARRSRALPLSLIIIHPCTYTAKDTSLSVKVFPPERPQPHSPQNLERCRAHPRRIIRSRDLAPVPVISGANGTKQRLASSAKLSKVHAIDLRNHGVGSCGSPGFYDTLGILDNTLHDICVRKAGRHHHRGINFGIQKGLQISRSTVRWFNHNGLKNPEDVFLSVEKKCIFKKDTAMVDLPELHDRQISQNGLNSSGGFCAGSRIVVDHQRIKGTSFVFSASVPALLAVSALEGINILRNTPSILSTLQGNDIVDETLAQGIWITWARRLRGQELVEARPSIGLAVAVALSRKECERAAGIIKSAVVKVLTKRK
ncbi:hypothetical protein H4582DRAFT_2057581 [Lactarius indigo]|nr:hypothetical protein H4582DRAFT_2057581 [Lactarius indigo]